MLMTPSVQKVLEEAQQLTFEERKELVIALVDTLTQSTVPNPVQRSLRSFRGLGAHLYTGQDAQDYVNQIRQEWDDRP